MHYTQNQLEWRNGAVSWQLMLETACYRENSYFFLDYITSRFEGTL